MMINAMMSEELAAAKESGMLMHTDPERHTPSRPYNRDTELYLAVSSAPACELFDWTERHPDWLRQHGLRAIHTRPEKVGDYETAWLEALNLRSDLTKGFYAILLAVTMCNQLQLYGFSSTPSQVDLPYHYWDQHRRMHDLSAEHALLDVLASAGVMSVCDIEIFAAGPNPPQPPYYPPPSPLMPPPAYPPPPLMPPAHPPAHPPPPVHPPAHPAPPPPPPPPPLLMPPSQTSATSQNVLAPVALNAPASILPLASSVVALSFLLTLALVPSALILARTALRCARRGRGARWAGVHTSEEGPTSDYGERSKHLQRDANLGACVNLCTMTTYECAVPRAAETNLFLEHALEKTHNEEIFSI